MNAISLPVSYGEAFDKLSILEIKLDKIKDERRNDVEKEYTILKENLESLFNSNINFHYRILKDINESIWIKQDEFRVSTNDEEKNKLCTKIIEENDRRFHVKAKINRILNSSLMEQKGYVRSKAFFLGNLGLGDMLTQLPIIRYLSTIYDKVVVVCYEKYLENCKLFYLDDPTISFYPIKEMKEISVNHGYDYDTFTQIVEGYHVYLCGEHNFAVEDNKIYIIPFSFYDECNIKNSHFWTYFHVPTYENSKELYNKVKGIPYCLVHSQAGNIDLFSTELVEKRLNISREDVCILNVNKNIYPEGHKWHSIANEFINKHIAFYKDSLENADYIFISDSCFFCFTLHLQLKTENAFMISSTDYSYLYDEKRMKDVKINISKIKMIKTFKYKIVDNNKIHVKYITEHNEDKEIIIGITDLNMNIYIPDIICRTKTFIIPLNLEDE
jgi:hypothetical protein